MAKKQKKFRTTARLPRGFGDRTSADIRATNQMMEKIRKVYELYGFDPIETPFFEYSDALGKFLPDAERPNAGVFSLQDDDEQWMSLRYDLTAPLARHVAQNLADITMPYRTYRAGWVFRNEKPGPGRFRQFTQFDADIVGAPGVAADAEMAMMMADTMEALGIARGDYVIRVNNRKVLDGVLEAIGLGGDKNVGRRLGVLRALDKLDRLDSVEIQKLLGGGRKDESGDWMDGLNLTAEQITRLNLLLAYQKAFANKKSPSVLKRVSRRIQDTEKGAEIAYEIEEVPFESPFKDQDVNPYSDPDGILLAVSLLIGWKLQKKDNKLQLAPPPREKELLPTQVGLIELDQIIKLSREAGYGSDRIQVDITCVRGLEYYTGMVYEAELTFDVTNDKGQKVQFGSVGGGGRYDGLVERFTGQKVPATGFSIGVSRLMTALKNLGKLDDTEMVGPVVVCVMDRGQIAQYQKMVAELRAAGIRAEMYQGNPKNKLSKQLQYADRRNSPAAIIVGSDEQERGVIQIKDLIEGKKAAEAIADNETWKAERPGQFEVKRSEMVAEVKKLPAVKAWLEAKKMTTAQQRRQDLLALISAPGVTVAKPPILLPASDYFDLAGEEFGRRLLLTGGGNGTNYCLRPDFTLPIAKSYIAQNSGGPAALSYLGPVFRQRAEGPSEFEQAGLELLAHNDPDVALARVFDFISKAFALFDIAAPSVQLGSIELFETLLGAAEMPEVWRPRVQRRFGNNSALNSLFDRLASPNKDNGHKSFASRKELVATISEQMLEDGLSLIEGRLPEEIADRYLEKQALAAARVPQKTIELLRAYLAISGPVDKALPQIETLFVSANVDSAHSIDKFRSHVEELAKILPKATIRFDAGFSPRLHYYTGLVFEITAAQEQVLASGGQYDRLLQSLGADREISACGCALWVERLEAEAAI